MPPLPLLPRHGHRCGVASCTQERRYAVITCMITARPHRYFALTPETGTCFRPSGAHAHVTAASRIAAGFARPGSSQGAAASAAAGSPALCRALASGAFTTVPPPTIGAPALLTHVHSTLSMALTAGACRGLPARHHGFWAELLAVWSTGAGCVVHLAATAVDICHVC